MRVHQQEAVALLEPGQCRSLLGRAVAGDLLGAPAEVVETVLANFNRGSGDALLSLVEASARAVSNLIH
jgi:hypothetical protein